MAERLAYAAEHGYTVLTNDLDFGTILAATQGEKPSVVQIRSDNLDPDVIGTHYQCASQSFQNPLYCSGLSNPSRLLMQPEADPLRVTATRESPEPRLGSRRIGFAARFSNASHRLLQLGHFEKNIDLRLRVVAM